MWHRHLGHPSLFVVQQVLRRNKIAYTPDTTPYVCDSCQLAKSHQLPYPISTNRSTIPLEQVFLMYGGLDLFLLENMHIM
jgi:histone deacetylase 1/2